MFDAVEESSFAENGVYYEVPVFNQRIGEDGTGTAGDWVDENFEPDADLIERAVENFGLTNDVREAFYVLPDGRMLDGSGRHWGGDERSVAGQRQVDHSDISEVIDDASGADAMYEWMGRTGAMRFDQIVGIASVARPPTKAQLDVLNLLIFHQSYERNK